jgi:hypothetical protein
VAHRPLAVIRAPWPSDKHSSVKKILAAGELDATPASRGTPPLAHRRRAFAVACRVALPLHLAVVTLWGSPIVAGELAMTGDTHSRAPVLLHLRPPRVSTQIHDHRARTL